MRRFVTRFASLSAVGLVALAALASCAGEAETAGPAPAEGEGEPVLEAGDALAGATSCGALIRSHVDWVLRAGESQCIYGGVVRYEIVTHQASGLVSRAFGQVDQAADGYSFYNPITQTFITVPSTLSSAGTTNGWQVFSDRYVTAKITGETFSRTFGFDPRAFDLVKATFSDDGKMVFKLMSWGGGEINVQPTECMNGLMYGFGNGALYSIRLVDECVIG